MHTKVIDLSKMPKSGDGFLTCLKHQPFFLPVKAGFQRNDGFPKFFAAPYSIVGEHQPNLINVWCFEDEQQNAKIVGGVAGPSRYPSRDWKVFDEYLASICIPEQYERVLELLDDAVFKHLHNPATMPVRGQTTRRTH